MNKKYFVIDEQQNPLSKDDVLDIEVHKTDTFKRKAQLKLKADKERIKEENINFKHTENRIIIKIDLDFKDQHTFLDGTKIYIGRRFNNLNVRETDPVNAFVIDGEGIPKGAEILIHPNSICDANKINGYEGWVSLEQGNSVRYYSIETISAFLYREGNEEWKPLKGFATAFRVFKPYIGTIEGILPTQIKNVLYLTSGEYKGLVCHTVKAADYCIIYMGSSGREEKVIRCRHYENEFNDREEISVLDYDLTDKVHKGDLLIGLSPNDCKKLNT